MDTPVQHFAKIVLWILAALVALQFATGAASIYLIGQNGARVDQIQAERVKNTRLSCEAQNAQNAAILGFITATVPPERRRDPRVVKYLSLAAKSFPQQNCVALVRERVSNP